MDDLMDGLKPTDIVSMTVYKFEHDYVSRDAFDELKDQYRALLIAIVYDPKKAREHAYSILFPEPEP